MNDKELKKDFEEYTKCLIKYNDVWEFSYDILDLDENTKNHFKEKIDKLLILLNENESKYLDMNTDDIYDIL